MTSLVLIIAIRYTNLQEKLLSMSVIVNDISRITVPLILKFHGHLAGSPDKFIFAGEIATSVARGENREALTIERLNQLFSDLPANPLLGYFDLFKYGDHLIFR